MKSGTPLKAKFDALRDWFIRYSKLVLPVILMICVGLTIIIAIKANKCKVELEESAVSAESGEGAAEALEELPLVPLEKDAVPGMNEFFDVVNIRASDSETADKLGKAVIGDTFKLLEERGNGWSKVAYNGEEAFIKSDYLEPSKTEARDAAQATETEGETMSEEPDDNETAATSGTVTVKENVRIRSGVSPDLKMP